MVDNQLVVEGIEGAEARIACRASGLPAPTYQFFKASITLVEHNGLPRGLP